MAHPYLLFISLILLGGIIGLIAGMIGIGGTSLISPFLIWIFIRLNLPLDLAVKTAFGSALCVGAITALTGFLTHRQRVEIKWGTLLPLTISVVGGAFCGSSLAHFMRGSFLILALVVALLIIAFYMIFNFKESVKPPLKLSVPLLVLVGFGIGLFASLVGMGGAAFTIIVFTMLFRYRMHQIVGISTFVQVFGALSGAAGYIINGYVNFLVVLAMLMGGIPLARFGARLAHMMEGKFLRRFFGVILLLLAGMIIAGRFK